MTRLPYGIAALCIRDQDLQIPGVPFGLEEPIPVTIRQVQLCVPLKTGPVSVLFVFMTEDLYHWAQYLEVLSGIMKSVSAEQPRGENTPEAAGLEAGGTEKPA
ncbi:hypothetical protein ACFU3E_03470 [Streptomyces sp. NPDC057424]|uniref:hypothetical protein n=1 Tax=Streptomyces sp. NPDC057424 TaxID=3346127 RepID=UPI0036BB9D00